MSNIKSLIGNVLSDDGAKYWSFSPDFNATFENNELQINATTEAYLTSINLSKYSHYILRLKLFNPSNERIEVGLIDSLNGFLIQQDIKNTTLVQRKDGTMTTIKTFSINFFSNTSVWHQVTIERRGRRTFCKIDDNIIDLPVNIKGDYLRFCKWHINSIKIKDIEILGIYLQTLDNRERKIYLIVILIVMFTIKS